MELWNAKDIDGLLALNTEDSILIRPNLPDVENPGSTEICLLGSVTVIYVNIKNWRRIIVLVVLSLFACLLNYLLFYLVIDIYRY